MLVRNLIPGLLCISDLETKKTLNAIKHVYTDMMLWLFVSVGKQTLNRKRFSVCISA